MYAKFLGPLRSIALACLAALALPFAVLAQVPVWVTSEFCYRRGQAMMRMAMELGKLSGTTITYDLSREYDATSRRLLKGGLSYMNKVLPPQETES